MSHPASGASPSQDPHEGPSPSPQPFAVADIWEVDDDDMEYQPASEQSEDGVSEYLGF